MNIGVLRAILNKTWKNAYYQYQLNDYYSNVMHSVILILNIKTNAKKIEYSNTFHVDFPQAAPIHHTKWTK